MPIFLSTTPNLSYLEIIQISVICHFTGLGHPLDFGIARREPRLNARILVVQRRLLKAIRNFFASVVWLRRIAAIYARQDTGRPPRGNHIVTSALGNANRRLKKRIETCDSMRLLG